MSEWAYEHNNGLDPTSLSYRSNKYAWWKCSMGHEYLASISHRGHGTNCPICNSGRQTSFAEQAVLFYIKKSFPDTISRYKTDFLKRMELNIYIPSKSVAIEYDGAAWHRKSKTIREHKFHQYMKIIYKFPRLFNAQNPSCRQPKPSKKI